MKRISDEYLVWLRELYTTESPSRRKAIELIDNIIEERKQQKAWTDAPDNAAKLMIWYYGQDGQCIQKNTKPERDLPKSPIREIAEKYCSMWENCDKSISGKSRIDVTEMAIKEAMALNA
jgi:hypothetical protein